MGISDAPVVAAGKHQAPAGLELKKCDIFSLGVMLFELVTGAELETSGAQWHSLRPMSGEPQDLRKYLGHNFRYFRCLLRHDRDAGERRASEDERNGVDMTWLYGGKEHDPEEDEFICEMIFTMLHPDCRQRPTASYALRKLKKHFLTVG